MGSIYDVQKIKLTQADQTFLLEGFPSDFDQNSKKLSALEDKGDFERGLKVD